MGCAMKHHAVDIDKPSLAANLKFVALRTAGMQAKRMVGLKGNAVCTVLLEGCMPAGSIKLAVSNGSLRTNEAPSDAKKIFKKEVFPALAEYLQDFDLGKKIDLTLHFHLGELSKTYLTQ